jgi:acyl-CoA thioester hydrolase
MTREPLTGREAYPVWREIGTRWADNDLYGHVNNSVYYFWFDTAVNSWLIEAGLLDVERGDPIGLVVETSCRYARSISYPDKVDVGLAVEHLGTSSVRYRIGIFRSREVEAAAEGHFVHVYVGRESRRPVPLPGDWRAALEAISTR